MLPQKPFDFIRQDKQLQKRIQDTQSNKQKRNLLKQYKDRKFDHLSRDIDAFNGELTLLLSHLKQTENAAQKKEFVGKLSYIVQLLYKNKAS